MIKPIIYFSDLLQLTYPEIANSLISIFDKYAINYSCISGAKDIWCRDYMPVQIKENQFVQFRYEPSYLQGKEYDSIRTNPHNVKIDEPCNIIYSEINLDGGNVLKSGSKVIISDRIFTENPKYERKKLLSDLEQLLEAEIISIPQINCDLTGHADGYVRFYNENTILVNELANEYQYWKKGILQVIKAHNLYYEEIPWFTPPGRNPISAIGVYINFIEISNLILLPKFEIEGERDEETYQLFQKLYPEKKIEMLNINPLAEKGGLLHCITWEIEKSKNSS
jgi:agmatine deiminase